MLSTTTGRVKKAALFVTVKVDKLILLYKGLFTKITESSSPFINLNIANLLAIISPFVANVRVPSGFSTYIV